MYQKFMCNSQHFIMSKTKAKNYIPILLLKVNASIYTAHKYNHPVLFAYNGSMAS